MLCNVKIRGSQKKWRILSNTLMNDEDFLHSSSTTPKLVPRKEIFYDSPSPYTHFCLVCFSADIGNKTRTSGIYSLPPCRRVHSPTEMKAFEAGCIVQDLTEDWAFAFKFYDDLTYDCDN